MTKSEEWEQFSAYAPMIEDAIRRGRNQREEEIVSLLETLHRRESKSRIHEPPLCAACRGIALIKE